jgi:replication factor C subunit 1
MKTKIINEDELLDLIRTRPGKKSKYTIQAEESFKKVGVGKPVVK